MVGPNLDEVASRYGGYIDELHQVLYNHHLHYGLPEDILPFTYRLAAGGTFHDEMASMVRAILYREAEKISRSEVLELFAVAVGGPNVETAPGRDESLRRLFSFVNDALRYRKPGSVDRPSTPPPAPSPVVEPKAPEPPIRRARPSWAEAVQERPITIAAENKPLGAPEPRTVAAETQTRSVRPTEQVPLASLTSGQPVQSGRRPRWLIPAAGGALVAIAAGVYFAEPLIDRQYDRQSGPDVTQRQSMAAAAPPVPAVVAGVAPGAAQLPGVAACVGPAMIQGSRTGLEARYLAAREQVTQQRFSTALPEFQQIASIDPAFPGIHLDLANALAGMHLDNQAKQQLDWQHAISDCLAKLPADTLASFCRSEFPKVNGDCAPQLLYIEQAADRRQVALGLGSPAAEDQPSPSVEAHAVSPVTAPRPQRRASFGMEGHQSPAGKPARDANSGDRGLVQGDGTDSALGAYSKPQ